MFGWFLVYVKKKSKNLYVKQMSGIYIFFYAFVKWMRENKKYVWTGGQAWCVLSLNYVEHDRLIETLH